MMQLPIDVVPGRSPPIFHWKQTVDTPNGKKIVDHQESLPATVEVAITRLIHIAKQLLMDNAALHGQVDLLTKQAEEREEEKATAPTPAAPKRGR